MDRFVMGIEFIFVLFLLYYSIEEIIEIQKHKMEYFKDFWNIVDILVVLMGIVCVAFNVYRTLEVNTLIQDLLSNDTKYANFDTLGYWQETFNDFIAVAVFVAWIKVCIITIIQKSLHLVFLLNKCELYCVLIRFVWIFNFVV